MTVYDDYFLFITQIQKFKLIANLNQFVIIFGQNILEITGYFSTNECDVILGLQHLDHCQTAVEVAHAEGGRAIGAEEDVHNYIFDIIMNIPGLRPGLWEVALSGLVDNQIS